MDAPAPSPDMGSAPAPQPPVDGEQQEPPMDAPEGDMPPEGPDDDMPDGGDEAKKEIQKLAGELSQKLSEYNQNKDGDSELNKYVGGMIFKQLSLDDADKDKILDKANGNDADDIDDNPEDGGDMQDDSMDGNEKEPKMESLDAVIGKVIREIRNEANEIDSDKSVFEKGTERVDKKERTDASERNPFRSKRK